MYVCHLKLLLIDILYFAIVSDILHDFLNFQLPYIHLASTLLIMKIHC